MPVPLDITALSATAASNSPAGSESPATADDYFRAHAAFIAQLRAVIGGAADANIPSAYATTAQVNDYVANQSQNSGTTGGTSTAYTLTPATALTSYAAGKTFWVTFHTASGAAPTLLISGVSTPPTLVRQQLDGTYASIAAGEIPTSHRSRVTLISASQALVEDLPPTGASQTARIDVASASTVNLTTSAPNTRHINITGTVAVTGFTVAAGQCYFAKLNGATLTNNANIVTQTGANIETIAGDTCILRATAANVVEVLSYCRVQRLTLGTSQATTSGTSIDFTGLPSWTKKITVMLGGVSTRGTSNLQIQLGTSGGVTTTGYVSSATTPDGGTATQSSTSGMLITEQTNAATYTLTGIASINLISGNTWVSVGGVASSEPRISSSAGTVSLSSALDRIRLTTVNGTDEFDAGSVNIIVEG